MTAERRLYRVPLRGASVVLGERTLVMGVLNVTPDSFSGGTQGAADAIAHDLRLFEEGADWIDVGGESTRPGAAPVAADEERRRVAPVIEALRRRAPGRSRSTRPRRRSPRPRSTRAPTSSTT